jgi:hypothetical protein
MSDEQFEVTGKSDHTRCFSQALAETYGACCKCTHDTIETRSLDNNSMKNWQFPKGSCPFKVGQIVTLNDLTYARSHTHIKAYEALLKDTRQKGQ